MKNRQEIVEFLSDSIRDVAADRTAGRQIAMDTHILSELGLDSLQYAAVLLSCERWLAIRITEQGVDWSSLSTVGSLARFLEKQQE